MAVIELTTQNFNEEVLQSDVPVMVGMLITPN